MSFNFHIYRSVPGNLRYLLIHKSRFLPAWVLTWDINSIHLYGRGNIDPLKFGTWALTQEWVLSQDITVLYYCTMTGVSLYWYLCMYTGPPSLASSSSYVHLSSESKFGYVLLPMVTIIMSAIIATVIAVVMTRVVNKRLVCFSVLCMHLELLSIINVSLILGFVLHCFHTSLTAIN